MGSVRFKGGDRIRMKFSDSNVVPESSDQICWSRNMSVLAKSG